MTTQPEALRLADALAERRVTRWVHATGETPRASGYAVDAECAQAAAELRRLHEINAELLEALKEAAEGIESWGAYASQYMQSKWRLQMDIDAAHAAIAKAQSAMKFEVPDQSTK